MEPVLRLATPADTEQIDALMKESAAAIFPRYYDEHQCMSAVRHVAEVDPMLLADGTYFVLEAGDELVACGGWSRRDRLYTGSGTADADDRLLDPAAEPARVRAMFVRDDWTRRGLGRRILEECEAAARREGFRQLALGATLPGVPLYVACGFQPVEEFDVTLSETARFPGLLYLRPEPHEPFVAMTEALAAAFPGFPPYGGKFEEIVPHVSVAEADESVLVAAERELAPQLPVKARVERAWLVENTPAGWRRHTAFPLDRHRDV